MSIAYLALEDGTVFEGRACGARGERFGEVVFNTSMAGYQEIVTDPSYAGQIITMTYPHIGNYGVNREDSESRRAFCSGFVVRELSRHYSNWRAEAPLEALLEHQGVVGIEEIDTRALVRRIRSEGAMRGVISSVSADIGELVGRAAASPSLVGRDLVSGVTTGDRYTSSEGARRVVAYDFGIKANILQMLAEAGCAVEVVPAGTPAGEVLARKPDGIFLSNGPGDPAAVSYAIETVGQLLGRVPIFGICLGHQILALALGGRTFKLKFGHRGANQPVKNVLTGQVEITAQNHGFAVDMEGFRSAGEQEFVLAAPNAPASTRVQFTHFNLNDGTVEGLQCLDLPAFSVQYHPEASPGPHDSRYLFQRFTRLMGGGDADRSEG